jgi:hypothetical protein
LVAAIFVIFVSNIPEGLASTEGMNQMEEVKNTC